MGLALMGLHASGTRPKVSIRVGFIAGSVDAAPLQCRFRSKANGASRQRPEPCYGGMVHVGNLQRALSRTRSRVCSKMRTVRIFILKMRTVLILLTPFVNVGKPRGKHKVSAQMRGSPEGHARSAMDVWKPRAKTRTLRAYRKCG